MNRFPLAIALLLALVLPPAPAQATWVTPPSGAYRVIEYNIGSGSECSPPEDCLALLKSQVAAYGPTFVLGEEFCYSDFTEFKAWLLARPATAGWDVEFAVTNPHEIPATYATPPGDPDPNGLGCQDSAGVNEAKGNVLAGDFGSIYRYDLMSPYVNMHPEMGDWDPTNPNNPGAGSARYYPLLCATPAVTTGGPSRVCVTHLVAGQATDAIDRRKQETRTIQNLKDGVARNDDQTLVGPAWSRPLIGGDFNSNNADGYYLNLKQDDLWCWPVDADPNDCTPSAQGTGTYRLTDPGDADAPNAVDHVLYRTIAGMSSSQVTVPSAPNLSTHGLRKSWVKY